MTLLVFFKFAGCLALLMYGMRTMSKGLQRLAGSQMRIFLGRMTATPLSGVFAGAILTAAVQSSTATTVTTVSFVNAGLLKLRQAISVIMGANIGTTLTAWIMLILGFQHDMRDVSYILFVLAIPSIFSNIRKRRSLGDFLFGFAFMFMGLTTLKQSAMEMHLEENGVLMNFIASCSGNGIYSILLFLIIGAVLTILVQSSAAIMAITMILCASGVLDLKMGIALVMGENIGTTITSNIAALGAGVQARRAALSHLIFNIFGITWVLLIFNPFINIISKAGDMLAPHNSSPHDLVNYSLCCFHSAFNVCNTLLLIGFTKQISNIACKVIGSKEESITDDKNQADLQQSTFETVKLIDSTRRGLAVYTHKLADLHLHIRTLIDTKDNKAFANHFSEIKREKKTLDGKNSGLLEIINKIPIKSPEDEKAKLHLIQWSTILGIMNDNCFNIACILNRKNREDEIFSSIQLEHSQIITTLAHRMLEAIEWEFRSQNNDSDFSEIKSICHELCIECNSFIDEHFSCLSENVKQHYDSLHYVAMMREFEQMSSNALLISQFYFRESNFKNLT